MTLIELARHFDISRWRMARALENAGHRIGQDLVISAQAKIGQSQPAIGPYPEWPDLADSTIAEKTRLGYSTPYPLLREGDLGDSIHFAVSRKAADVEVILYSNDPRMPAHEYGMPSRNLPARPVLGPTVWERSKAYTGEIAETITTIIRP